ncbi:MAG: ketoacyl-ACP synthase III [Geopsychrobacter sp.]|nr:ketoacyl-ACP synthase III [Geopsychrobacter sp.]
MRARIAGTGSCMPEKVMTNFDLEKLVDTTNDWIVTRTGIKERRIAAEGEFTSDLATRAAERALEMAGIPASEIDLIVLGTVTGDYPWPSTACIVQNNLGAKNAYAYDLSAACSGFLYGLGCASDFIQSGRGKKVLVIGAETLSRILDWTDRNTCVLFGDGAGAVVLEAAENSETGLLSTHMHSDGSYLDLLYQPGFGTRMMPSVQGVETGAFFLKMQGNEVFKVAVRSLTDISNEALAANNLSAEDIALFIPHQANKRILEATAKRIKMKEEQVYVNVHRYGNTSSATIPVALDEANRAGLLKVDDNVLLSAFGGGFTWASALIRWS